MKEVGMMSSNKKRTLVYLPEEVRMLVEKDATANNRSISNQIMDVLCRWYLEGKQEKENAN